MKNKQQIEDKIKDLEKGVGILTDLINKGMSEDCFIKAVSEVFSLHVVGSSYSEKDLDDAYDKGFKDGCQRDRE